MRPARKTLRSGKKKLNTVKTKTTRPGTSGHERASPKDAQTESGVSIKIEDLPLITTRRWYVTLSAAIGIVGSIVSATYFVVDYARIRPIEKELEDSKTLLASAKSDTITAKSQLERAEQKNSEVVKKFDLPTMVFPPDRSSVVGSNLSFVWEYGKHDTNTRYILALRDMAGRAPEIKMNVDRPETKSMFYAFDPGAAGTYVWWVRPGRVVSEEEIGEGPWSSPAVFTIYPSVSERIRATGKLLVASTPTSYDMGVSNKDGYGGFEVKVLRWLAPRLCRQTRPQTTSKTRNCRNAMESDFQLHAEWPGRYCGTLDYAKHIS